MELGIENKIVLISGSTAGIGLAIAKQFLMEKAEVIINGRTQKRVEQATDMLKKQFPKEKIRGVSANLSTQKGCSSLIKEINKIDILINNLGIYEMKNFTEISDQDWQVIFETNVMSGVRLSRHYLPKMMQQNWGRILFISSESAVHIPADMIHYGMSKTAQVAIARGLAETTKGTNVTVNSVLAGPTTSEGVTHILDELGKEENKSKQEIEEMFFNTIRPTSLLQRFTTPEEVANTVVYFASQAASATNGAAIRAEGGVLKSIL